MYYSTSIALFLRKIADQWIIWYHNFVTLSGGAQHASMKRRGHKKRREKGGEKKNDGRETGKEKRGKGMGKRRFKHPRTFYIV